MSNESPLKQKLRADIEKNDVVVYAKSNCKHSAHSKKLLEHVGADFKYFELD